MPKLNLEQLQSRLRFGWAAVVELIRNAATAALIVGLVVAGAGVVAFLAIGIPAALLALVATVDEGILRQGRTRIDVPRRNRRPKIANRPPGVQA